MSRRKSGFNLRANVGSIFSGVTIGGVWIPRETPIFVTQLPEGVSGDPRVIVVPVCQPQEVK